MTSWDAISAKRYYGMFLPKSSEYIDNLYAHQDRIRYFNDHHRNTGRYIRYSWMRGYNPVQQYMSQGRSDMRFTRDMYSAPLKAWNSFTGKSVRNLIDLE